MTDITRPLTTHQRRIQDDQRAKSIYARRRDIERWHEQQQLERELKEPTG